MSTLGGGLSDGQTIYVPIPKNGSSAHRRMFAEAGWEKHHYARWRNEEEAYVVWRHPIDRWFAGAFQYSKSYDGDYEQMVCETADGGWPVFDEHTMRQTDFLLSTFSRGQLVKLENATRFVDDRWGLTLPTVNERTEIEANMVSAIKHGYGSRLWGKLREFYIVDLEIYESAI